MPEIVEHPSATRTSRAYSLGAGVAVLASFLLVWTTIVRDDGSGGAIFMVILAAGTGAFAVRLRADGLARAMLGVAAMQAVLGLLTATAPITATLPDGVAMALYYHGFFAALWLVAAACFRIAAR